MSDNVSDKMSDKVNIAIVTHKSRKPPTSKLAGGFLHALRISALSCASIRYTAAAPYGFLHPACCRYFYYDILRCFR